MTSTIANGSRFGTHDVLNQPSPLQNYNPFEIDRPLVEGVRREGAAWAEPAISAWGARVGSEEVIHWGFLANEVRPVLRTHDRFGHRIDEVEFHPAWHELLRLAVSAGLGGGRGASRVPALTSLVRPPTCSLVRTSRGTRARSR